MLRRMTVNSRSDNCMDPLSSQGYTYALSLWMPRHGQSATGDKSVLEPTMINTDNDYSFKSFMGTSMGFDYDWYTIIFCSVFKPPHYDSINAFACFSPQKLVVWLCVPANIGTMLLQTQSGGIASEAG